MSAIADADKLDQAQEAMLRELEQFKDTLADESELAKAINQFTAGNLSALKTMQGPGRPTWGAVGSMPVISTFPGNSWRPLAAVKPVTLQAVANRYLTPRKPDTFHTDPPPAQSPSQRVVQCRVALRILRRSNCPTDFDCCLRKTTDSPSPT